MLREKITFEKADGEYMLSFGRTDEISERQEGDSLYFVYHSGKNGVAYVQCIGEGMITSISAEQVSVRLHIYISEKEFLEKFIYATIEQNWEF